MEDFWLGTTAAATVATAIATGFTLWLRQRDRPEVYWHITGRESRKPDQQIAHHRDLFTLVNAGDGIGYRVELTAAPGEVQRRGDRGLGYGDQSVAVVNPGDRVEFVVRHDGVPKDVVLRVSWVPAPTRLNRPVVEWIPLAEGLEAARTGSRSGASDWRRRDLRWWQMTQRYQQWVARRARVRHQLATVLARKEMRRWREQAEQPSKEGSEAD